MDKDDAAKNLDKAHEHADPSRGDKDADGGERVKSGSHGAADEEATKTDKAM